MMKFGTAAALLLIGIIATAPVAVTAEQSQVATTPLLPDQDCTTHPYSIALEVHNVRKTKGLITVDLHDDNPEGFLNNTGLVERVRATAESTVTLICIPVSQAGTFAIALYHDKDANHKFNKNWLGIPSEPYGISNDPRIGLSAPPHRAAAFEVTGPGTPIKVTLRGR